MTTITFDTHAYIKELEAAGFTEKQAEVQAKTLASIFKANLDELATKGDLDVKIAEAKTEIIKWMFGVAAGQAVFVITILKMFPAR